jgi:hypothetical protein
MCPAQRDREFVADLLPKPARLSKTQVVWVGGLAAANEAGLLRHGPKMLPVSLPLRLGKGQNAFVDAAADVIVRRRFVRFGWREGLIRCWLEAGEPILECQSDPFAVRRRQGFYLWPRAECPPVQIVVRPQPCDLGQHLVPQA